MVIQPSIERFTIIEEGDRTRIVLPSRKFWFVTAFLGFWLVGWACGEVTAVTSLFGSRFGGGPTPFMLFWLAGWTAGGAMALFTFLWQLAGSETIAVSGESLSVWQSLFGLHLPPRVYSTAHIRDLRVPVLDVPTTFGWSRRQYVWGTGPGAIAFDYGARTIHIAAGADEAEAKLMIAAICLRYPNYRRA